MIVHKERCIVSLILLFSPSINDLYKYIWVSELLLCAGSAIQVYTVSVSVSSKWYFYEYWYAYSNTHIQLPENHLKNSADITCCRLGCRSFLTKKKERHRSAVLILQCIQQSFKCRNCTADRLLRFSSLVIRSCGTKFCNIGGLYILQLLSITAPLSARSCLRFFSGGYKAVDGALK